MSANNFYVKVRLQEKEFKVFHKAVEISAVVRFFYTPEEKPTSDCPGNSEDFEIIYCGIDNCPLDKAGNKKFTDMLEDEFCDESGYYDVQGMCEWFDGLEKTIMKKFYEEIEADKKGDF